MYPLRYVSSFSFLFGICRFPDIIKKAPDRPQRGRCCRGGWDSHLPSGSKQDCVISTTSCPTASREPKEQRSESPNTDISVHRTPVSSLGPGSCCLVWAYSVSDLFHNACRLSQPSIRTSLLPTAPHLLYQRYYFWLQCADWVFTWQGYQHNFFMLKPQNTWGKRVFRKSIFQL